MFTGLIETLGTVRNVARVGAGRTLIIEERTIAEGSAVGDSVAINGACLTVVRREPDALHFEAGPETLQRTNLGELAAGDRVNLERSLRLGHKLGGHLVQGHVDGLGRIAERRREGEWEIVRFDCPKELTAQMVSKGSVAVDGVSLTLVEVGATSFTVALIPHTLARTTLGVKQPGAAVNLETDILGKYMQKYVESVRPQPSA